MRAVVIGASGQIGHAVCRALLDTGVEVVACHRGSRELQSDLKLDGCCELIGERHSSEDLAQTLKAGADLLVDVVPMIEADAEQLVAASGSFGALTVISTGAVYADDEGRSLGTAQQTGFPEFPSYISETQPTVEPDSETYAGRKVAVERKLLDHSRTHTTILRPCAVHGSYARDLREVWFLKRVLDGRSFAPLAYDGESRFHTCAAETIAAAVVASAKSVETQLLNVADGNTPTVQEIGETLLEGLASLEFVPFSGPPQDWVGMSPWSVPLPICLDTANLTALIGPPPFYREKIAPTAAWALEQLQGDWTESFPKLAAYPFPLFNYDAEDAYMANRS